VRKTTVSFGDSGGTQVKKAANTVITLIIITVILNGILIYFVNLTLQNQSQMLANQHEMLERAQSIQLHTQETGEQTLREQSAAVDSIMNFINRSDAFYDRLDAAADASQINLTGQ
jgi:predicted PurR-regulated permease PerM